MSLLTDDNWWGWWNLGLSLNNDQITWLWGWWGVQVLDGDFLGVLELVQSLLNDLWVRVLVDLVLFNWDWATELVNLLFVEVKTFPLTSLDLFTGVDIDWLLGIDDLLLDLAVEVLH